MTCCIRGSTQYFWLRRPMGQRCSGDRQPSLSSSEPTAFSNFAAFNAPVGCPPSTGESDPESARPSGQSEPTNTSWKNIFLPGWGVEDSQEIYHAETRRATSGEGRLV